LGVGANRLQQLPHLFGIECICHCVKLKLLVQLMTVRVTN
jgi:hypothetical protein